MSIVTRSKSIVVASVFASILASCGAHKNPNNASLESQSSLNSRLSSKCQANIVKGVKLIANESIAFSKVVNITILGKNADRSTNMSVTVTDIAQSQSKFDLIVDADEAYTICSLSKIAPPGYAKESTLHIKNEAITGGCATHLKDVVAKYVKIDWDFVSVESLTNIAESRNQMVVKAVVLDHGHDEGNFELILEPKEACKVVSIETTMTFTP